jgi:hypothetical protein
MMNTRRPIPASTRQMVFSSGAEGLSIPVRTSSLVGAWASWLLIG